MIAASNTSTGKRTAAAVLALVLPLALGLVAPYAGAGSPKPSPSKSGPPKGYKCDYDTQTCLNMMAAELKSRGWIGINYDDETFVLDKVVDGSPADAVDMRVGDKLVSVNDQKFTREVNPFEKVRPQMTPGKKLNFVMLRKGKPLRVTVTLAEIPPDIRAQILGLHMMEHAQSADVAAAKP